MVKRTDSADEWAMHDNTRDPDNKVNLRLRADSSGAELTTQNIDFNDNGFQVTSTSASHNASGGTYIYMAFADTRDAQFNFDASGNKNNWTPNNINSNASSETTYDIMNDVATLTDEDTTNFATLNPLNNIPYGSVADGNLKFTGSASVWSGVYSSIKIPSTGKWYAECVVGSTTSNSNQIIFGFQTFQPLTYTATNFYGHGHNNGFFLYNNGTFSSNGGFTTPAGTLLQIAIDADAGKAWYGYNNNWYDTYNTTNGNPSAGTNPYVTGLNFSTSDFYFVLRTYTNNGSVNFGQRPFKYTPPTGFKKLNTYNLPDSTIVDGSQYFDAVTYTGDSVDGRVISGYEFAPDLVWSKSRSNVRNHELYDTVRGATNRIVSNLTDAESVNASGLKSFTSDGYTFGTHPNVNNSGESYVNWSWRGSDSSPVTNTNGTITSTVSANTTSGFSVVTYTGNGTSGASIGHGLGTVPKFGLFKKRNGAEPWTLFLNDGNFNWSSDYYQLDTGAKYTNFGMFHSAPTSSTVKLGSIQSVNGNGSTYVGYLWSEVEGFSKFGSFTDNNTTDNVFIYTGFKPAFVMWKCSSTTGSWAIWDTSRDTYNIVDSFLLPNSSGAEGTAAQLDIVSNGFKVRAALGGSSFIYMAFAENPFKQSLAR